MKNVKFSTGSDWVFFFIGVAITALFLFFSTPIYELMYYNAEFSNEMYNENMYFVVASATALICWGIAILYYWVIDYFERWYHWIIAFIISIACTPVVTYVYPDSQFSEANLDYSAQLGNFAIVNIIVSIILFLIASFSVKNLSSHCSTTPF
ncbi:MAG TPA: hypothetical protein H9924_11665 [Candidatus Phocaeicola merdavium]|nr:hypothetical protein [Candidatus Phocaeicola merdavium]